MTTRVRTFDFDRGVPRSVAIRTIIAALEDEGLELTPEDNTTRSSITTVLVDGYKRVIVPGFRIRPKLAVLEVVK